MCPQVGVYTKADADADIATHKADGSAHHTKTDIFDKYRDFVCWRGIEDTNAWTKSIDGAGFVKSLGTALSLKTDTTSGNKAFIYDKNGYNKIIGLPGLVTAEWVILYPKITAQTIMLYLILDNSAPPDEGYTHFGFKIVNASIFASNSDDSTQKITDTGVDLAPVWQFTRLKVVVNPGVDCKFYVNGVLKVTHTENLPIDEYFFLNVGITTNEDTWKSLHLGRFLFEKAYA